MIAGAVHTALFYLLACAAIALALAVTGAQRLLRAAVCLMGVLAMSAGLYVLLGAEFLAGIQVLVYVGGIVVLIVFTIMLTRSADFLEDKPSLPRRLVAVAASVLFLLMTAGIFLTTDFRTNPGAPPPANEVLSIGRSLLGAGAEGFVLPFEVVSLLLLAAVLGSIVVARKTPPPDQPFTSGGDRPGEVHPDPTLSQNEAPDGGAR
jgi:NADH-quinone oxidoreductase subunit J